MAKKDWRRLLHFRCTGCGNCCRETVVCLTDEDVRRIEQGTGKPAREFARFFPEEEVSMDKRDNFWIRFANRRAVMALRWRRNHCYFLGPDNRCTIYEHRPVTCREYPFNTTLSKTGAVERVYLSRAAKCLHDWDGRVTRKALRAVLRWNERQSEAYAAKVKTWNGRLFGRKSRPAFLRYLGFGGDSE
ncbi:MAG: YkgJ family cysteine cluster protein [Deltaproteobacteria bacterium]|nr:YkgJ family cysteine cluster protein [Deltaproteobacteria bacterium]